MAGELRTDPLSGAVVAVAVNRQDRPNQPAGDCPFCVGGLESPEPYRVRAFVNRWPSFADDRCEIVLYTPDHDATFWSLDRSQATAVVDLWAERTASLGSRNDVAYVLVGENRTATVGATIAHPHGQIFAYEMVPPVPRAELERARAAARCPLCDEEPGDRLVASEGGWRAWVPSAATHPFELVLAPTEHVADLPSLDAAGRDGLAATLAEVLARLDHLWPDGELTAGSPREGPGASTGGGAPRVMPSMLWFHQRPTDGGEWPEAHVHAEIAVPMRAPGLQRFVAAMELGSGVYVNPVVPEEAAAALRAVPVTW